MLPNVKMERLARTLSTLGNLALLRALETGRFRGRKSAEIVVSGVTPELVTGDMREAAVYLRP
jgi:hypothetical protein